IERDEFEEVVPANRQHRHRSDSHEREEAVAVRKLEIQPGMGGVKPPLNTAVAADFRGERAYEVDQRGIASRKRWTGLLRPVGADNPGVVAAVGVDLHNRAVFEPGL